MNFSEQYGELFDAIGEGIPAVEAYELIEGRWYIDGEDNDIVAENRNRFLEFIGLTYENYRIKKWEASTFNEAVMLKRQTPYMRLSKDYSAVVVTFLLLNDIPVDDIKYMLAIEVPLLHEAEPALFKEIGYKKIEHELNKQLKVAKRKKVKDKKDAAIKEAEALASNRRELLEQFITKHGI